MHIQPPEPAPEEALCSAACASQRHDGINANMWRLELRQCALFGSRSERHLICKTLQGSTTLERHGGNAILTERRVQPGRCHLSPVFIGTAGDNRCCAVLVPATQEQVLPFISLSPMRKQQQEMPVFKDERCGVASTCTQPLHRHINGLLYSMIHQADTYTCAYTWCNYAQT
jgi:hypothetical protein